MRKRKIPERAVDFILSCENEELRNLKVNEVASRIKANRSYLSWSFKDKQNISISNFILREKIYRAMFILDKHHDTSIDELSMMLGFLKVEDFVNEFEKHLAIEPKRYLEIMRRARPMQKKVSLQMAR